MAYSVAVIQSGIYAHMQTTKAIFALLICIGMLSACGLKGPLYLPQDEVAEKPTTETPSDDTEEENKKDSGQLPVSIR